MQLTDRQTNAALQAIIVTHEPKFHTLPDAKKSELGRATFGWWQPLVQALPAKCTPRTLSEEHWDIFKDLAENFLVGLIRYKHPVHRHKSYQEVKNAISLADVETQAFSFLQLAQTGLSAALAHDEMQKMADAFYSFDLDQELQELVACDG